MPKATKELEKKENLPKIDKLTPEQEIERERWLNECMGWGTCTKPADRPRAEAAIAKMYRWMGKEPPQFIWCPGPMAAIMLQDILTKQEQSGGKLSEAPEIKKLVAHITARKIKTVDKKAICKQVIENVSTEFFPYGVPVDKAPEVKEAVKLGQSNTPLVKPRGKKPDELFQYNFAKSVREKMAAGLEAATEPTMDEIAELVTDKSLIDYKPSSENTSQYLNRCFYGQYEMGWIAFYTFCGRLRDGIYSEELWEKLNAWLDVAQSCSWWFPYSGVCLISDRPTIASLDENRMIHNDTGPALAYRDGWKVYAIHGVRIPEKDGEKIVMRPQEQTLAEIDAEDNEEIRRIRIDRYGWLKYLEASKAKVIDSRTNDIDGTREILVSTKKNDCRLVCSCISTGRQYSIGVPNTTKTCAEAQVWMRSGSPIAEKYAKGQPLGAS